MVDDGEDGLDSVGRDQGKYCVIYVESWLAN